MHPAGRPHLGRLVALVLFGVAAGVVGTGAHRALMPWGIVIAIAAVLSASIVARAYADFLGLLTFGAGWALAVELARRVGPGGDVLIPAQPVGYAWLFGGMVAIAASALAPGAWFRDEVRDRGPAAPLDGPTRVGTVAEEGSLLD